MTSDEQARFNLATCHCFMKRCPYCGYSNLVEATECRKCQGSLVSQSATLYEPRRVGPQRARDLRSRALSAIVIGLLMKVYWGGYGPWPVLDSPPWANVRAWAEPLLIFGGAAAYVVGWILKWV